MPSRSIWRSCSINILSDTECGGVIVNRIPVHAYGAIDWRSNYQREFPTAANWITEVNEDPSPTLPLIAAPCLLIWGDADAISPPAVGRELCELLPDARLHIVRGGDHNLAQTHADQIAPLITEHLQ